MAATSALFTIIGTSILHNPRKLSQIPPLKFNKLIYSLSVRFSRCCFSAAILDSDVSAYTAVSSSAASTHPWPEWVNFVNRLKAKGYLNLSESSGGNHEGVVDYTDMNLLKGACLSFARHRYDIFKLLSTKDIQTVVEKGCPNVFRKSVNSGKRLRAYLGLDEGDVCSSCTLRGTCDRAYILLDDSEVAARTVDIVRMLLFYALDPLVISGEKKPPGRDLIEASAKNLLLELVELGETPIDPDIPESMAMIPRQKKHSVHSFVRGSPQDVIPRQKKQSINSFVRESSQDVEMRKGDWVCTECSFMNFARNTECLKCKVRGPRRVSLDTFEMKKGDWNCPECSFMNYANNKNCFRCQEPRPPRELKPGDWECPDCDFMNFNRNDVCKRCNLKRPNQESLTPREPRPPRELKPGDWECPDCDFMNFNRNNVCKRCNLKRPNQESLTPYGEQTWKKPYQS